MARNLFEVLDPGRWGRDREIVYDDPEATDDEIASQKIEVRNVPYMRGKITMDRLGNFYIFNRKKRQWFKVGHGIFVLYRMICHMLNTHRREAPSIRSIRNALSGLNVDFKVLESPEQDRFGQGKHIQGVLAAHVSQLARAVDEDKVEGCVLMVHMIGVHRLGEGHTLKPVVLRCLSDDAREVLLSRLENIQSMQPHLLFYRAQIRQMILLLEDLLDEAIGAAESLSRYLDPSAAQDSETLLLKIRILREKVAMMQIKPYSHCRDYALAELDRVRAMIVEHNLDDARRFVSKVLSGLRIMKMRKDIELAAMHLDHAFKACGEPVERGSRSPIRLDLLDHIVRVLDRMDSKLSLVDEAGFSNPVVGRVRAGLDSVKIRLARVRVGLEGKDCTVIREDLRESAKTLKETAQYI